VRTWPGRGLLAVASLVVAAMVVPAVLQWHVHANAFAPLTARWHPRFGPGTLAAAAIAGAAWRWAPTVCRRLRWRALMFATFLAASAWLLALAAVDGRAGLASVLEAPDEYLQTARSVTDVPDLLHHFLARIAADSAAPWPTHVAGHPPGALLFFVLLVRLHLGGGLAAGIAVTVLASTTPIAVASTVRLLATEAAARRALPFLALGPAAIWSAVSADAVFTAVAAWGLWALAAATCRTASRSVLAVLAGVLLGACVYLSYGLVLVALLAVAVLIAARAWHPLPYALAGAGAVVLGFTVAGFAWWQAIPQVRTRYYAGIAAVRPAGYWLWGDLGALAISAGLVLGPSLGAVVSRARRGLNCPRTSRAIVILTLAAALCIASADLSLMSKAEVERIWLPFVPWLLLGAALLPSRWRSRAFAAQLVTALVVQTLLFTRW
jgi:hypothetical protein